MSRSKQTKAEQGTKPLRRLQRPTTRARGFSLKVTDGPDKGSELQIAPNQPTAILVGQSPVCELRLGDNMVSRRHLALELFGDGLQLRDLGSTNGTRVNGLRVSEAVLAGGEQLVLGATTISVGAAAEATDVSLPLATSFGRLVGASAAMRRLYPLCQRLAATDVSLVIEGETGTGKEVLAEALHEASARAEAPFVIFDCTTVPTNLFESALFGHERGAFTGATEVRNGVFAQAHGGTLLIDEIGDLTLELQAKLLRAIERGEVQRVGGNKWLKVDVRVLTATRRDLDAMVQEGTFRDDLFYRLAVARVELPPLRKRAGDAVLLARHFWSQMSGPEEGFPEPFVRRLTHYRWPGNVRELHNAVARQIALGDFANLSERAQEGDDVGGQLGRILALDLPFPRARRMVVDEFERRYLARVLEAHDGNVVRAGAAAGVAPRYFRQLRARNRDTTIPD